MKKMTAAFQKLDQERDQKVFNFPRFIDVTKILCPELTCVAYAYTTTNDKPAVIGFTGRAKKPAFNYVYSTVAERDDKIKRFMAESLQIKKMNGPKPRRLDVGDILRSSWGYEQTNIDYYKVLELVGKTSVKIVEIGQFKNYDDQDRGTCKPNPDQIIGEPMVKRANGEHITLTSYSSARKIDADTVSYWSSYH